jgi:hypothetical protein
MNTKRRRSGASGDKRPLPKILERWIELDRLLSSRIGLHIPLFLKLEKLNKELKKDRVSESTLRRDLRLFKQAGQKMVWVRTDPDDPVYADLRALYRPIPVVWKYLPGVLPLFTQTLTAIMPKDFVDIISSKFDRSRGVY